MERFKSTRKSVAEAFHGKWWMNPSVRLGFLVFSFLMVVTALAVGSVALAQVHEKRKYTVKRIEHNGTATTGAELVPFMQLTNPGLNGIVDLTNQGVLLLNVCNVKLPTPTIQMVGNLYTFVWTAAASCGTAGNNYASIMAYAANGSTGALTWGYPGASPTAIPAGKEGFFWYLGNGTATHDNAWVTFTVVDRSTIKAGQPDVTGSAEFWYLPLWASEFGVGYDPSTVLVA